MNRQLTAIFAALEALLVVGIGVGLTLVPLSLLWAFEYGLQLDWAIFWRIAADAWLIGHGVDVHVALDAESATLFGFAGASSPFTIGIAALGFAVLTATMAMRTGRRIAETPHRTVGLIAAVVAFAALALAITVSAFHEAARPSFAQGLVLPTFVFVVGLAIGAARAHRRIGAARPELARRSRSLLAPLLERLPGDVRIVIASATRGGLIAVAAVVSVSAASCAALIAVGYAEIISLYESVHAGVLGGIALTLGQLALAPNFVVWAASWFVGPGFAIGTGSSVGPLGTALGPMPVVPILGAVPVDAPAWGFLGILVPVLAGFAAGVAIRPALQTALGERAGLAAQLVTGVGIGVVGGALLGLLALASGGPAGPGRLVDVGSDPVLVAAFAAIEIGVAGTLGILAGRHRAHG
ncbi:MAG: hypothetical protein KF680_10995 [Cryobacterium sp.]|nr:hypothetical protein [Cryobacterium sp.]